jgi:tetratricopeptide (TPR) repeat protein
MFRLKTSWLMIVSAICFLPGLAHANDSVDRPTDVEQLIQSLGSDSYATRVRARERLQRMGLEAFDQLHAAQFHFDIEIAMAARYLVSSLAIDWSKESDPQEVREALIEYGAQSESERTSRIDMLAEFTDRKALSALVRLVRFETSLRLSRRAALAIMQQAMVDAPEARARHAEQIREGLGDNERQGAQWLRVYAEDLASGQYSADRWRELIAQQRQEIDSGATEQSSRPAVLELVRVTAARAAESGQKDEAIRLAIENMDLIKPGTTNLVDAASWAIDNDLHPFVLQLQQEHQQSFSKHPMLLYAVAEALMVASDTEKAEEVAGQAAAINPLPRNEEERAAMQLQPNDVEVAAESHRELGEGLRERGLFRWAEREYRQVIDALELDDKSSTNARADLADMLADLQRHQEVVDVLKPLVERVEKDGQLRQQLNSRILFQYNRIRSEVDYHSAIVLLNEGKLDEARPLLASAYRLFPPNVDILIRMYRVDGDDEWRNLVETTLERTIRMADSSVQEARAQAKQMGAIGKESLSHELNQYAWLVSNTQGDLQKALNYSLMSLELEVDAAKLDTCARCYFALGDLENAIMTQKRALRMMPHSPPLQRQLAEFEAAAKKKE